MPDRQNGDMAMMSTLPVASARLSKLWILCLNDLLDRDLCKICFISILIFFLVFKQDFVRCVDFTRTAPSNTASDDVKN